MGVYIPNMDKPKFCKCEEYNCFAWDDKKYKCKITEWKKPCPLINIVQCKDCKWSYIDERDGGTMWCKVHFHHYRVNDDGFCNYGERRSDET